jgi:pimeloyl-ACP methyl ester carboxylesterase
MPKVRSQWTDMDGPTHWVDLPSADPDAPSLLAVHGLGGSHANWLAVAPLLAATHHVYALDLAGHGRTQAHGRDTGVVANQRLVDRFIREVVGEPVTLLGNSMGGLISISQASRHPDTVRQLVLVAPALPLPLRLPRASALGAVVAVAVPGVGPGLVRRRRAVPPRQQVRQVLELCCVDADRVPSETVASLVELATERARYEGVEAALVRASQSVVRALLDRPGYRSALDAIQAPVLVLHGEQDRLVPVEASRQAVLGRPSWQLRTRPDLGHVPQLEDPVWTADTIHTWLAALSRQPPAATPR